MRRACVILSPTAGRAVPVSTLREHLRPLVEAGWEVRIEVTDRPGGATAIAEMAVNAGYDLVVAAGGDGTVSEALQPLVGTDVVLGVLPLGTGNVWAREVGIPLDLPGAVRVLLEGRVRRVDVGRAGHRNFLLMAGIGFDAAVTRQIDPRRKRRLGMIAYLVAGVAVAFSFIGHKVQLNVDGVRRTYRALLIVIGNSRRYGGDVSLTAEARIDDGLLDVCVFKGTGLVEVAWHLISVLLGRHVHDPGVDYLRARRLTVVSDSPLPVQVDGDTIGETPMAFTVRARSLNVLVPVRIRPDLFAERPEATAQVTGAGG